MALAFHHAGVQLQLLDIKKLEEDVMTKAASLTHYKIMLNMVLKRYINTPHTNVANIISAEAAGGQPSHNIATHSTGAIDTAVGPDESQTLNVAKKDMPTLKELMQPLDEATTQLRN